MVMLLSYNLGLSKGSYNFEEVPKELLSLWGLWFKFKWANDKKWVASKNWKFTIAYFTSGLTIAFITFSAYMSPENAGNQVTNLFSEFLLFKSISSFCNPQILKTG